MKNVLFYSVALFVLGVNFVTYGYMAEVAVLGVDGIEFVNKDEFNISSSSGVYTVPWKSEGAGELIFKANMVPDIPIQEENLPQGWRFVIKDGPVTTDDPRTKEIRLDQSIPGEYVLEAGCGGTMEQVQVNIEMDEDDIELYIEAPSGTSNRFVFGEDGDVGQIDLKIKTGIRGVTGEPADVILDKIRDEVEISIPKSSPFLSEDADYLQQPSTVDNGYLISDVTLNLPQHNSGFTEFNNQERNIELYYKGNRADDSSIEVFYLMYGYGNPNGDDPDEFAREPNCYYYWKEGNVVPKLEESHIIYNNIEDDRGGYNPEDGNIYMFKDAFKGFVEGKVKDGLELNHMVTGHTILLEDDIAKGLEGLCYFIAHEELHKQIDDENESCSDADGDGVCFDNENSMSLYEEGGGGITEKTYMGVSTIEGNVTYNDVSGDKEMFTDETWEWVVGLKDDGIIGLGDILTSDTYKISQRIETYFSYGDNEIRVRVGDKDEGQDMYENTCNKENDWSEDGFNWNK